MDSMQQVVMIQALVYQQMAILEAMKTANAFAFRNEATEPVHSPEEMLSVANEIGRLGESLRG